MDMAIGLIIGLLLGSGSAYALMRKAAMDAEKVAETVSAKMVTKQAEQILQLAESKLAGKKEVIDGSLKSMKDEMKEKLREMEEQMKSIGQGNVQVGTRLSEAAKIIGDLRDTTGSLKNALASNSSRGQWGERMAEDVLRLAGMIEGINYIKQRKLEGGSKPDFTFLLPQNLKLNMDVKFPFNNYQQYTAAATDGEREEAKKKFLRDVRQRVKEIQTRDYIDPEDSTVDYVLLFVPNEQIFGFINEIDRELIDEAMKAKTILCSPLSLYAILAVVRQSIDNFRMESKSREMLSLFGAFKDQWEKFKDQMEKVGKQLGTVSESYHELVGTRERQLEKPLTKIEEIRIERGIDTALIEDTVEKVTRRQIAESAKQDVTLVD
ncbi:MAG TPA: DNA recombination protein RmuC [Candidatus Peribacteraceae bacterium]|nr:DNA recombination protein RmuC [Candidatus Peribacteraceae bacterium]